MNLLQNLRNSIANQLDEKAGYKIILEASTLIELEVLENYLINKTLIRIVTNEK